jgi:predicted  nucleic acid-binding Zn-ribbon protein
MPNKCANCGKIHPDNAEYLLDGCDRCGSKFFFYIKQDLLNDLEKEIEKLTTKEVREIERDVRDIIPKGIEKDETVVLDLEAIRVMKPGKYLIDVTNLLTQKPIVIRVGPGKYKLDLSVLLSSFRKKQVDYSENYEED